jgi:Skp family chaperone for outer membrane proteins
MNGLDELKVRNETVQIKGKALQDKLGEIETQIKAIDGQLKDFIPKEDTKKRIEALALRLELKATLEARGKAYQQMINLENGDILQELYLKVQTAAATLAQREGFDLILIDDRPIKLPPNGTDREYNEVIQSKRIIYARDGLDITPALRTMMNNEFAAGTGKTGN